MLPWSSQLELVRAIWTTAEVQRELGGVLSPEHFENPALGWIMQSIIEVWQEGQQPTDGQIRAEFAKLPKNMEGACLSFLEDVAEAPEPATGWAIAKGRAFAAHQEALIFAGELPTLAANEEWTKIKERAGEVVAYSATGGDMTTGLLDPEEVRARQAQDTVGVVPTGIRRMDKALPGGGLGRGQIGHVLAKKGGGKSQALVSLGAWAAMQGFRVHHASFEDGVEKIKARYDRSFTDLSKTELLLNLDLKFLDLQRFHDRLTVVDLRTKGSTIDSIHSSLDKLPKDKQPDLIIIDYLQKIRRFGSRGGAAERRTDLVTIAEDAEKLALERKAAVWAGWQANRFGIIGMRGKEQRLLDITDYAECIEAAYSAAVIFSLNKNMTEEGTKYGKINLCENRDGESGVVIDCIMDWSKSQIRDPDV